jgi:hypothetical protein
MTNDANRVVKLFDVFNDLRIIEKTASKRSWLLEKLRNLPVPARERKDFLDYWRGHLLVLKPSQTIS